MEKALADENAAEQNLARSATKDRAGRQALLDAAKSTRERSRAEVIAAASAAHIDGYVVDYAKLGVSLIASQESTDPAKVTLSNTGKVIQFDSSGAGQLVITVGITPDTDTVAVSVAGAALRSVLDGSGAVVPFTAKHGFVLSQAGVYTLNLSNLNETSPVVLTAQALKGGTADGEAQTQPYQPIPPRPTKNGKATSD